jgi:hypothetical protein
MFGGTLFSVLVSLELGDLVDVSGDEGSCRQERRVPLKKCGSERGFVKERHGYAQLIPLLCQISRENLSKDSVQSFPEITVKRETKENWLFWRSLLITPVEQQRTRSAPELVHAIHYREYK